MMTVLIQTMTVPSSLRPKQVDARGQRRRTWAVMIQAPERNDRSQTDRLSAAANGPVGRPSFDGELNENAPRTHKDDSFPV